MPNLIPEGAAALITAIAGAASAATGIYESTKGAPATPGMSATDKLKAKLDAQKRTDAMIANQAPNVTGATGGGVSPQYTAKVAATSQGLPFNPGDIESEQLKAVLGNMFGESGSGGGTFG